jgi:hypothetical protein
MLLVNRVSEGTFELNYMWLPTWLGMNTKLKKEMETELAPVLQGKTPEEASDIVLDFLCSKFPLEGLRDYLDGLKFIQAQ